MIRDLTLVEKIKIKRKQAIIKLCWINKGQYNSLIANPAFMQNHMGFVPQVYEVDKVTVAPRKSKNGLFCYANIKGAGAQIAIFHATIQRGELLPYAILEVIPVGRKTEDWGGSDCNYSAIYVKGVIKEVYK